MWPCLSAVRVSGDEGRLIVPRAGEGVCEGVEVVR